MTPTHPPPAAIPDLRGEPLAVAAPHGAGILKRLGNKGAHVPVASFQSSI